MLGIGQLPAARTAGVELTNNFAERQLRHAVMLRKISSGSQSADGMEWTSRLLTVVMTTRSQGRNPHDYFVELARAAAIASARESSRQLGARRIRVTAAFTTT